MHGMRQSFYASHNRRAGARRSCGFSSTQDTVQQDQNGLRSLLLKNNFGFLEAQLLLAEGAGDVAERSGGRRNWTKLPQWALSLGVADGTAADQRLFCSQRVRFGMLRVVGNVKHADLIGKDADLT